MWPLVIHKHILQQLLLVYRFSLEIIRQMAVSIPKIIRSQIEADPSLPQTRTAHSFSLLADAFLSSRGIAILRVNSARSEEYVDKHEAHSASFRTLINS